METPQPFFNNPIRRSERPLPPRQWAKVAIRLPTLLLAVVFAMASFFAHASEPKVRSIDVTGEVVIAHDGSVQTVELEPSIAPEVAEFVRSDVSRWRFEPVMRDGSPIAAKTGMQLFLSVTPADDGFRLRIDKVWFVNKRAKPLLYVIPSLPVAVNTGNQIELLAAMRVNSQGEVTDVALLSATLDGRQDNRLRKALAKEIPTALKRSKFRPADEAAGELGDDTFYLPIDYFLGSSRRGVVRSGIAERFAGAIAVPWLAEDQQPKVLDLPNGNGEPVGVASHIRLLTPPPGANTRHEKAR